jgi:RNA polymerase sigma-70 factor (ECF subfamily)
MRSTAVADYSRRSMGDDDRSRSLPPHMDAERWDGLMQSVGQDSLLVVIRSWIGERLRAELEPEDVLGETWARAWIDREQHVWRDVRSYRAWLLAIARNRIRDAADRLATAKRGGDERTARFSELGSSSVPLAELLPVGSTTPSRIAQYREAARAMQKALASLPEDLGAVVRLRLFEELPWDEIAATLGVPESTARSRFNRGADLYRRELDRLRSGIG